MNVKFTKDERLALMTVLAAKLDRGEESKELLDIIDAVEAMSAEDDEN